MMGREEVDLFDLVSGVQAQIERETEEEALESGIRLAKKKSMDDGVKNGREVLGAFHSSLFSKISHL